jgi:iron complex outermembrane receptor protein
VQKTRDGVVRVDLGRHESKNAGTPALPMDMIKDDANKTAVSYNAQYGFGEVEAKIYRHEITHLMDNYSLRGLTSGMLAPATSNDTGYQLNTTMPRGDNTYRLGMEYLNNDFDAYSQASSLAANTIKDIIRNGKRSRLGVFGEWEANLSEQWKTSLGLRSDTVNSNADAITNRGAGASAGSVADQSAFNNANRSLTDHDYDVVAQARYRASDSADYDVAIARKTRSPNLVERYLWSTSNASLGMADGKTYIGNLELKPEVSTQLSVGANWHADGWKIKPSLFYNRVSDYIQGVAGLYAANAAVLKYTNVGAELYGMDGNWEYPKRSSNSRLVV